MGYESYSDNVKKALLKKKEKAAYLIGELIEGGAKLRAPVGQIAGGSLRQDINHQEYENNGEVGTAVGTDKEYAIYVEKGTGIYAIKGDGRKTPWVYYNPLTGEYYKTEGMRPHPFLEPAAMEDVSKIKDIVKKVMSEIGNERD